MNKNIKYALVFTGGVAVGFGVCGYKVLKYALNDDGVRSVITDKITDRIKEFINGKDEIQKRMDRGSIDYEYDDVIFETRKDAMKALEKNARHYRQVWFRNRSRLIPI